MITGGHGMPKIMLSDGQAVVVTRVTDRHLSTNVPFPGSRNSPYVIEVAQVDGKVISPTKLVVGDDYSIWLNHQTNEIPRRDRDHPAVPTGLTPAEGNLARSLFLSLAGGQPPTPTQPPPPPTTWGALLKWLGKHVIEVLAAVIVAVLTAAILAWLGLSK